MSRTISLTNEAYDLLKSMKLKGKSFSDIIKRLARKGKLSEVLYMYPELQEIEEFENAVKENRKAIDMRL